MFTMVYNAIEFGDQGSTVNVNVDAGLYFRGIITKSAFVEKSLESGQKVCLGFKSAAIKII